MRINEVTFKAGGEAGSGIATICGIFAKLMQRAGLYALSTNDYPSLIRGGHNTVTARASMGPVHALHGPIDILVALDANTIAFHSHELAAGGALIYDATKIKEASAQTGRNDLHVMPVPLSRLAQEAGGEIFFNQGALGASCALLGIDLSLHKALIERNFGRKGADIVAKNMQVSQGGYDFVKARMNGTRFDVKIVPRPPAARTLLIAGNDAVCTGAIAAGVKMVAEYPMSPSSSVLHWMAAHAVAHHVVVKHTEDELAAANWLCGAGFAGVRCLTATSGGGFSLMAEALGNAGIAEIPIVIVEDQRAGPSTGLPTYTEQADLQFALRASQGEFPRIVACPGDPEECFFMTFDVFNMADEVQTPAIILLDKYLAETAVTVPHFDLTSLKIGRGMLQTDAQMEKAANYRRHLLSESGLSPRCIPGQQNGIHVCSSYEHDETGFTSEEAHMRVAQIDKRERKMSSINPALYQPAFYGDSKSNFLLVSWGSTKGAALEALKLLMHENIAIRFMHIRYASPFAAETVKRALLSASQVLICEGNSTAQMRALIREKTGIEIANTYLRYDGRPFEPQDIAARVRELLQGGGGSRHFVHRPRVPAAHERAPPPWSENRAPKASPAPSAPDESRAARAETAPAPAPSAPDESRAARAETAPAPAPSAPSSPPPADIPNPESEPSEKSISSSASVVPKESADKTGSYLSRPILPSADHALSPSELAGRMRQKSKMKPDSGVF